VVIILSSILLIVQCEFHIAGVLVGYIHSVSHEIEKADKAKQFLSRYSTIEAGVALKTNVSERGRSRHHRLIFRFDWLHRSCAVFRCVLIGCTDAVLYCDVDLLIGCVGSECSFVA
jgi:hypothetical protein